MGRQGLTGIILIPAVVEGLLVTVSGWARYPGSAVVYTQQQILNVLLSISCHQTSWSSLPKANSSDLDNY